MNLASRLNAPIPLTLIPLWLGRHYTHFSGNKCRNPSENRTLNPQKKVKP